MKKVSKKIIVDPKEAHKKFKEFCNSRTCNGCEYLYKHSKYGDGQCEAAWMQSKYAFIDKKDLIKMQNQLKKVRGEK